MTTDSNQSPSDLPELPESLKHLGEGPLGDSFRLLFAELVKECTVEQIAQIVSGSEVTPREIAELKTELEAEGWKVLTSSTPRPNPLNLDIRELKVHIPTLESFLFPQDRSVPSQPSQIILGDLGARKARAAADWKASMEAQGWTVIPLDGGDQSAAERPSEPSGAEKLQAAARPTRYSGLPDDLILLRPDAKTLDQRLKDLLGGKLNLERQAEAKNSDDAVSSDQLAAFEQLCTDEEAVAAPETTRQAEDIVPVPSELWHAVRGILGIPGLREALVRIAEQEYYRPDWYAEDLDLVLDDLAAFDAEQERKTKAEQEKAEAEAEPLPANPGELKLSDAVKKLLKRTEGLLLVDPLKHSKSDAELRSEGNRVHDLVEKSYREKGFSATVVDILFGKLGSEDSLKAETEPEKPETPEAPEPTCSFGSKFGGPISGVFVDYLELIGSKEDSKLEEPSTGRDLSADFSLQDLIADYDESKIGSVSTYIQSYGHRFSGLYGDLAQILAMDGFNDRDRLVMVLGALDGYEASEDYHVGNAYYISQIRQLLKRR